MQIEQLSELTHDQLKEMAHAQNISISGNKAQLAKRLADATNAPTTLEEVVEVPKKKFHVIPKNGVAIIVGDHGVPSEGVLVEEGHVILRFDNYFNITEVVAETTAAE